MIFSTPDDNFIIKNISNSEMRFFITKLLAPYYSYLVHNPESRLVRLYGMYEFPEFNENVMLMEKTINVPEETWIFDIKGSTVSRQVNNKLSNTLS